MFLALFIYNFFLCQFLKNKRIIIKKEDNDYDKDDELFFFADVVFVVVVVFLLMLSKNQETQLSFHILFFDTIKASSMTFFFNFHEMFSVYLNTHKYILFRIQTIICDEINLKNIALQKNLLFVIEANTFIFSFQC
jgi:hypothetical protein